MKKVLILIFLIFPTGVFSASGYWQITSSNFGPTPFDAATSVCNSAGIYCQNFSFSSYLYDSSRSDLQTVYLYRPSGSVWSTETAQFIACQDGFLCSDYNFEAGVTFCEDGYYLDSADALGYPNTCDRPLLKICDDGSFQLESGFCPIILPVCSDSDACLNFAQSQLDCSGSLDTNFTYIDSDNFSYSCTTTTEGQDSAGLFGCNIEFCGGVSHVEGTGGTDTGSTGGTDTGNTGGTDTGSTGGTDTGSTGGTDTGSTGGTDTGNTGGADTGGTGGTGGTGTVGTGTNGPCDPTQPNYMDCITTPSGTLPPHTEAGVGSFDEANQIFKTRLDASPIVQSFSSMPGIMSVDSSACPSFSINFPSPINKTVSTEVHCDLMNTISPIISSVMIIVYTFAGFRIFASA